ncbi:hypothetical protein LAZ67_2006437 [Cordylochernes scorpioides]|uniref:Uncharacterized protein n=1 Tax=Cordylochernes scorpioides TaxID=51811 RepID=A0ABY6K9Y1_9ARAC|nr:hypothetical protein LAZ67_2006437 [Cordylochernes scorpioides]
MPGHRKRRQFKQTDAFTRGMVIGLKRAGWSIRQIVADTHLGASTVHRLWRRWLEQGNVAIYRNVNATRVTSARVDRRILRQAVAAPQATCTAILQHVQDTLDHSISTRTISRRLVANGLHSCRPLRRLPLTPPNRRQRLEWCRARSTWMTEWHRVVFSDESRFCLSSDSRRVRVWRRRGERSNPAAIVERPTVRQRGIMVWGAIAYDSRSPLLRIQGTMTAQRYVDDVLRPLTLPYFQGVPNALYQQDNARPPTARISQQALQDVQMLPWPPYSPDLSPIEHVWDIIGRRLHALPQPRSEDELWQMVEREWRAIPQDAIRTLIDSLPRRVAACIAVRGFHRRVKAKTSLQDDDVPIDDTTTKPLFTTQEKRRKRTRDKVPTLRWNPWQKHVRSINQLKEIIELIDTVKLNLRNLELLGINEEQLGNMLLTTFILKKIDSNMNKDFELSLKENTFPTLQDLLTFLEKHRKGLDHINGKIYQKEDNVRKTFKTYQVNTNIIKCSYCNSSHKLDKLNIALEHTKVKFAGFNTTIQSQVNMIIKIKLSSIYDNFKFETKALIVKDLSNKIPNFYTHNPVWPHLNNLKLADPEFYIPRPIDIIIGTDLYLYLIEPGLIKGPRDAPSAMNSKLGWIISGRSNMPNNTTSTSIQQIHINHSSVELVDIVKKNWDAESIPTHKKELNTEEFECENIFRTTTFRDEKGRYVVSLPFRLNHNKMNYQLGDSKSQVLRRFLSLERRFHQNPVYFQHVREFMQKYINLGHMEVINEIEPEQPSHQVYYIPYNAVLRDQSTTTKLRVVFDASAKTSTGLSLNDLLYCASPNEPIKEYQLVTLTYGTTNAPYLAIKTLKTLVHDEQEQFPQATKALHLELVSDLSTGSFIAALIRFTSRRELTTFLTQIEATLNKRPLTPLSEDPNDLEALTPAHFLSGPSTSNLPETDNQQANLSINLSSRWKNIQELKKYIHFALEKRICYKSPEKRKMAERHLVEHQADLATVSKEDPTCPHCQDEDQTVDHLLFTCPTFQYQRFQTATLLVKCSHGGLNVQSGFKREMNYAKGRDILDVILEKARESVKPTPVKAGLSCEVCQSSCLRAD